MTTKAMIIISIFLIFWGFFWFQLGELKAYKDINKKLKKLNKGE